MSSKPKRPAISYARFSDPKQAKKDSEDRQARQFKAFCESKNLVPRGEAIVDRGLSAYKGTHKEKGRFGVFLQAIEEGLVDKGTVLVVEALDRLSRAKPHESMKMAADIMKAGVDIGVVMLGDIFTEADLGGPKAHTLWMFFWLAHQESKQKAERIGESWKRRRHDARESGKLMSRRLPAWLEAVQGELRPIPERVAVVKRIFRLAAEGSGHARIVKALRTDGVPPFSAVGKWTVPYVDKMLNDQRVLGNLEVIDGTILKGYYPQVIDDQLYRLARDAQAERANGGNKKQRRSKEEKQRFRDGKYVNLFRSLLVHARDGEGFFLHNRGTLEHPKLILVNGASMGGRADCSTFPYLVFEEAVLRLLKEVNPADVLKKDKAAPSPIDLLRAKLANLRDDMKAIKADIKAKYSKQLSEVLRDQEAEEERLAEELQDELAKAARPVERAWEQLPSLVDLIEQDGDEARRKLRPVLRRMIADSRLLIVRRRSWLLAALQLFFSEGGQRSFLIAYQSAGNGRKSNWAAHSFASLGTDVAIDLRKPADVRKLEKVLLAMELPDIKGA